MSGVYVCLYACNPPGKMFRTHDLPMIVEFFLMFQRDKPIDWLLDHILWVKVCNPEKDAVSPMYLRERIAARLKC